MFTIDNGSIVLFVPDTHEEQEWLDENVESDDWQWAAGGLAVDHRYASDLKDAIENAGFEITEE